jgi:hypothetical protein
LLFLNGASWGAGPYCPSLGETDLKMTMYAVGSGAHNLTLVPCSTGGIAYLRYACRKKKKTAYLSKKKNAY